MMGLFKRKVRVTFIDDRTDDVLKVSEMALSDLPESFATETDLEIGGKSWSVMAADPPLQADFAQTRQLKLRLRPIERIPPEDILYSLPTICDSIPESKGAIADGSELAILEDDWRQIEFISEEFSSIARKEMEKIELLCRDAGEGAAFREIHVRELISQPISTADLGQEYLDKLFGPHNTTIKFQDHGNRISDTFYYRLQGTWILYGQSDGVNLHTLGLNYDSGGEDLLEARHIDNLNRVGAEFRLLLVDWCNCVIAQPRSPEFNSVFSVRCG